MQIMYKSPCKRGVREMFTTYKKILCKKFCINQGMGVYLLAKKNLNNMLEVKQQGKT